MMSAWNCRAFFNCYWPTEDSATSRRLFRKRLPHLTLAGKALAAASGDRVKLVMRVFSRQSSTALTGTTNPYLLRLYWVIRGGEVQAGKK